MLKPPYLKPGDRVAIVSPSGAVDPVFIDGACDTLRTWGLNPVVGKYAKGTVGRFSGTDAERLSDLQQALDDPAIRAVFCGRGGYGMVRIIDKLDFQAFVRNPKWLVGFSDITVLHAAALREKVQSLHAVMARALANYGMNAESVDELHKLLFGEVPDTYVLSPSGLNRFGVAEGRLAGGNLSVLYGLRGTNFDIRPGGKILFIEDLGEKLYHIDRMMQNLRLGGVLSEISGLLVGRFTEIEVDASFGKSVEEIIASAVADYSYPVAFNFPVGHVAYNLPVIHGAHVRLSVTAEGAHVIYV